MTATTQLVLDGVPLPTTQIIVWGISGKPVAPVSLERFT
jgi:hypothetical protein